MEYSPYGNVWDFLHNNKNYEEENMLRRMFQQMVEALMYIHYENKFIHRDIKPDNILLFNAEVRAEIICKLSDFGMTTNEMMISKFKTMTKVGTEYYMPYEQESGKYGF